MSEFEKWFVDQDFYTNMRFIHGDALFTKDGDVYRVLPVQMTHLAWVEKQSEIDQLKAEKAGLEKRMHKAISKWVAITSIVTTQRNGLPDEFYQKLDQLHDVLTGFDEALRGEHE